MAEIKLEFEGYRCERCGHRWVPRKKERDPIICPECKSPYYNIPRKHKKRAK